MPRRRTQYEGRFVLRYKINRQAGWLEDDKFAGTPGTLQDLVNRDCMVFAHPSGRTTWQLNGPDGAKEVQVRGRFSGNTAQAVRKATLAGPCARPGASSA